jgi:hypothetical protein
MFFSAVFVTCLPSTQGLSQYELLVLHAEIKALQQMYGLSYKDAAHRLYHSELRQVMAEDAAYKSFTTLYNNINRSILMDIENKINQIDTRVSRGCTGPARS